MDFEDSILAIETYLRAYLLAEDGEIRNGIAEMQAARHRMAVSLEARQKRVQEMGVALLYMEASVVALEERIEEKERKKKMFARWKRARNVALARQKGTLPQEGSAPARSADLISTIEVFQAAPSVAPLQEGVEKTDDPCHYIEGFYVGTSGTKDEGVLARGSTAIDQTGLTPARNPNIPLEPGEPCASTKIAEPALEWWDDRPLDRFWR